MAVLFSCAAQIVFDLWSDLLAGGNAWKQGDWLVNSAEQPIRRALIGDAVVWLSDISPFDPLQLVAALQLVLLCVLFVSFGVSVVGTYTGPAIFLVLTSPAAFLFFWTADPQAALRKELLVFVALGLLLLSVRLSRLFAIFLGGAVSAFTLAMLAHEAMVLFLPVFVAGLALVTQDKFLSRRAFTLIVGVTVAVACLSLFYAHRHASVADHQNICAPLVNKGLSSHLCSGAIFFLERGLAEQAAYTARRVSVEPLYPHMIVYGLALIGLGFFLHQTSATWPVYAGILCLAVPFLPLYAFGIDWGRWMSFHVTSAVFLILLLLSLGRLSIVSTPGWAGIAVLGGQFFWSVDHLKGFQSSGVLERLFTTCCMAP